MNAENRLNRFQGGKSDDRDSRLPAAVRNCSICRSCTRLLAVAGSIPVHAQTSSAAITGTIRDSTGAVIPDAELELTNIETGTTLHSLSNAVGNYNFLNILPGTYTLGAAKEGFRTAAVEPFTLQVNQTATFDIVFEVGAVTETLTVEALGAQIQSQTSEIGNVVAERQVVDLPLNGRNFTQLLSLSAGVAAVNVSQSRGGFTTAAVGEFTYPSINGQTNRSNFFTLDGIYNTGVIQNTPQIEPIIDTILEFKVQSHNDHAEFGQGTGGIVNVVTKSGANELHGSAWWYLRNDNLDARNFFQPTVTPFTQNQFGAAGGGPVVKNKVFFFGSFQGFRYRRSGEAFLEVPTDANLRGDLSDTGSAIFDPWSTRVDPQCIEGGHARGLQSRGLQRLQLSCLRTTRQQLLESQLRSCFRHPEQGADSPAGTQVHLVGMFESRPLRGRPLSPPPCNAPLEVLANEPNRLDPDNRCQRETGPSI